MKRREERLWFFWVGLGADVNGEKRVWERVRRMEMYAGKGCQRAMKSCFRSVVMVEERGRTIRALGRM